MMTYEELKQVGFIVHHKCAGCGAPVGYEIHPEMAAACFNSGCDCGGGSNYRVLTHQELADIPAALKGDHDAYNP